MRIIDLIVSRVKTSVDPVDTKMFFPEGIM